MPTVTERKARRTHACSDYRHVIERGQRYRRHVAFPGDEGHEEGTKPWVLNECNECILAANDRGYWIRRRQYRVPAHVDARITFQGRAARIWGFDGAGLLILLDGDRHPVPAHPTWKIEYDRPFDPRLDTPHDLDDADHNEHKEQGHDVVAR